MHPASLALLLAATQSASSFDYVYVSTKYSWANASSNCQSHGAELASLHSSADEDNARENSGGGAAWIGFNDRTSEGSWVSTHCHMHFACATNTDRSSAAGME